MSSGSRAWKLKSRACERKSLISGNNWKTSANNLNEPCVWVARDVLFWHLEKQDSGGGLPDHERRAGDRRERAAALVD